MKKIGDCEVYDGMTAKFTACATGWPEPEYEWFLDTNRLYETERIRMEKEGSGLLRLKILHADSIIDSGRYKLRIYNPHGEAYCEASIIFDSKLIIKYDKKIIQVRNLIIILQMVWIRVQNARSVNFTKILTDIVQLEHRYHYLILLQLPECLIKDLLLHGNLPYQSRQGLQ